MSELQLVVTTDLPAILPEEIEFNHAELKKELCARLKKYKNLVVTEDGIKDAKEDRARLNKLRERLEDERKSIKKACETPYKGFEAKIKELTGMIAEPILAIDTQIKAFDDAKKQEKLERITEFYRTCVGGLLDVLPLEKVLNPKWVNATVNESNVTAEIAEKILKARNDLQVISAMRLPCEVQVKDAYLRNLDMSEALAEKTRFEERERQLAEVKRKAETVSVTAEQAAPIPMAATPERKEEVVPSTVAATAEDIKTIRVVFYSTTPEFRREMRELTQKHSIEYGGIK